MRSRWRDPGLLVLASLAGGAKHGYAITLDVEQEVSVRLGPGALYGALSRLEQEGLVEALDGDERRRPYRLTAAGEQALDEQLAAVRRVADFGAQRVAPAVDPEGPGCAGR